ncbi:MAG TPA: hypothetical protein DCG76_03995, partial [Anaerovibrio sp.]|nr:hypothetical protein [Anaerovibrio sp.]
GSSIGAAIAAAVATCR